MSIDLINCSDLAQFCLVYNWREASPCIMLKIEIITNTVSGKLQFLFSLNVIEQCVSRKNGGFFIFGASQ